MGNEHYWEEKDIRAKQARRHTGEMVNLYGPQITECIQNTKLYEGGFEPKAVRKPFASRRMVLDPIDSVSAVFEHHCGKTAVLNFSSFKNPGGMFLVGSKAQEECLCHESFLYNVLSGHPEFYAWNRKHLNKALYMDRALYSPDVLFLHEGNIIPCDVITCAAPNKAAASKYVNVSDGENREALESRIRFILDIAVEERVATLILGAYGCGVFGQDPAEVAGLFMKYLRMPKYQCFWKVVFAIPEGKDGNYEKFRNNLMKRD